MGKPFLIIVSARPFKAGQEGPSQNDMSDVGEKAPSAAWPSRTAKGVIKHVLGFAMSFLLLAWILYKADLRGVWDAIQRISLWPVLLTLAISYVSFPLRTLQWQWLMGNPEQARFPAAFRALSLGYLGNFLLPMRGGEFLKAFVLARSTELGFARTLSAVVLARFQDLLPILLLAMAVFWVAPLGEGIHMNLGGLLENAIIIPPKTLYAALGFFALAVAGGAVFCAMLYRWQDATHKLLVSFAQRYIPRLAPRLAAAFEQVSATVDVMGEVRLFWGGQAMAFLCWALFVLAPIPLLCSFSLSMRQASLTSVAINGLATFAHLLPSGPGALGTFHVLCLVALYLVNPGMDPDDAVAYTLIANLLSALGPALPGLFFLPGAWSDVRAAKRHTTPVSQGAPADEP